MPRYHFHFEDGIRTPDDHGTELRDLADARRHALHYAGHSLADASDTIFDDGGWKVEVTDAEGVTLFTIMVSAKDSSVGGSIH